MPLKMFISDIHFFDFVYKIGKKFFTMDTSTENVTINAGVITDMLKNYREKKDEYRELFKLASGYESVKPTEKVPIQVYLEMCNWIEHKLGKFNLIRIGRLIGESTYETMIANKMTSEKCTPVEVMKALIITSQTGVQDPKKRGWEILSSTEKSIIMRKTQNFNPTLQLGLLDGLIRKSGVFGVQVIFHKEIAKGAEYDEYLISWM